MKQRILLVGAGGHARSCIEIIESSGRFEIFGLIGSKEELTKEVLGYKVLGTDADLERLREECSAAVVAIGQIKTSGPRSRAFALLEGLEFVLPTIQASTAYVSPRAIIDPGTMIFHHAVINCNVRVGKNCIINSCALLEHDVQVGNHTHISTGVRLNGQSEVSENCFIGSGSVVRETVKIGAGSIIGMGSVVLKDVASGTSGRYLRTEQ